MLTNFLLEHPWLSPLGLCAVVLLGPLAGAWLAQRPKLAWQLTAASLIPVALFTLVPVDRELFGRCTVQWALPTWGRIELLANVALFVVPTLLAGVAARRPALAFVSASGLSAGVEALQGVATGLGRSCDTTDWLSNTIGAAVGATLAAAALILLRARSRGAAWPDGSRSST